MQKWKRVCKNGRVGVEVLKKFPPLVEVGAGYQRRYVGLIQICFFACFDPVIQFLG